MNRMALSSDNGTCFTCSINIHLGAACVHLDT